MRPWSLELSGRLEQLEIHAPALEDNHLGDPATRPLWVYLPPSYDASELRYPTIYLLQGYGNYVDRWMNRTLFDRSVPELLDAAFANGAPPCVAVFVDAWTALGGSQFLDSAGTGRYHTYLCEDVVSFVDARFRTLADRSHRAVVGHSSGGYGAMVSVMLRPDVFGAFASHAGDCDFELTLRGDVARAHRALRDHYERSYARFFADFGSRPPMSLPDDFELMMVWAMAACYSAEPDGTVTVPFDPETGELRDESWGRWLERDPLVMADRYADSLRSLRGAYLDAGRHDEYLADIGAEAMAAKLHRLGVNELYFELYEGTHGGFAHRLTRSVAYLAERIS